MGWTDCRPWMLGFVDSMKWSGTKGIMKVLDAGHFYELDVLDTKREEICAGCGKPYPCESDCPCGTMIKPAFVQVLHFVKRNRPSEKYPGNDSAYAGTTIQEVCRALIDRCQYVNKQIWCSETEAAIRHLRGVIVELETRAAKRHGRKILPRTDIENEPTCKLCGHIQCEGTCKPKEAQ